MKLRPKIRFFDSNKNRSTIPISQLKRLTGREWCDLDYSWFMGIARNPAVISFLNDPLAILKKLEIRYMNAKVGYGLYASEDIPKDTVIGFISGELKKFKAAEINFDINNPRPLIKSGSVSYDNDGNIKIIDSSIKSNHIHYVQHLPSEKMLSELKIPPEKREAIYVSNLTEYMFTYDGYNFTYFYASRYIKKGEIIGCAYQNVDQEKPMTNFCFFGKRGEIINYSDIVESTSRPSNKM
jgi:hypothetical protein